MVLRLNYLIVLSFLLFSVISNSADQQKKITFKKEKISIAGKVITVELAESPEQQEYGLMNRNSLPTDEGMLFIFKNEQILNFWMKNTNIDLSIGYFDKNKKLTQVLEMKATSMLEQNIPTYPSEKPCLYALEMNKNWFKKNKIKMNSVFSFIK